MTTLEECFIHNSNYEDYVLACNKNWVTPLSKETYYAKLSHWNDAQDAKNNPLHAYLLGTWERQK